MSIWSRWVRRRRLIGLTFLWFAAVATAAAVLLFATGDGWFTPIVAIIAGLLTIQAVLEFIDAAAFEKAGARYGDDR